MKETIKILLVDDHRIVRKGLSFLLSEESDISVIGEAEDGESALFFVKNNNTDIVLMDIKMPGIGGVEATRRIIKQYPGVKVIAISAHDQDPFPVKLIKIGAFGFLEKDCSSEELIDAIHRVYKGNKYVSSKIAQDIAIKSVTNPIKNETEDNLQISEIITDRERQIITMLANGYKTKKISEKLMVTTKTINTYRYRIYKKLNVNTDVELTHIAILNKFINIKEVND